jgi:hypothetical protein
MQCQKNHLFSPKQLIDFTNSFTKFHKTLTRFHQNIQETKPKKSLDLPKKLHLNSRHSKTTPKKWPCPLFADVKYELGSPKMLPKETIMSIYRALWIGGTQNHIGNSITTICKCQIRARDTEKTNHHNLHNSNS